MGLGAFFVEGDTPAGGFDSVVPTMLQSLPDLLIAVVIILVLSASMSTLSSLVITSSSTFTIDFLKGIFFPKMNNKRQMLVIRLLCAGFIAVSVLIALNPNSMILQPDVDFVGRAGGGLSWAVFVWPVLEKNNPCGRLGGLYLWYCHHRGRTHPLI